MGECEKPDYLDGNSLMPELKGKESSNPDWVFSEFHGTSCNTGNFMVRKGDWKYIVYVGYQHQLFNLKEDPYETNNLIEVRPKKAEEMESLLREIVDYKAVDAKVKDYDKKSFREWREERKKEGKYQELMSRIFSGWENLSEDEIESWTDEDEKKIE